MKFAENGYYVVAYDQCENCGKLLYGRSLKAVVGKKEHEFCSDWCLNWFAARPNYASPTHPTEPVE